MTQIISDKPVLRKNIVAQITMKISPYPNSFMEEDGLEKRRHSSARNAGRFGGRQMGMRSPSLAYSWFGFMGTITWVMDDANHVLVTPREREICRIQSKRDLRKGQPSIYGRVD